MSVGDPLKALRVSGIGLATVMLALLAGCAGRAGDVRAAAEAPPQVEVIAEPEWRAVAKTDDAALIDTLDEHWRDALAAVRGRWARARDDEGALLDPQAAQGFPAPSPGSYVCRVVRLSPGGRVTGFRPWTCHIGNDNDLLSFTKEGGSDRPAGWIWKDSETRLVFLGAMVEGGETPAYGEAGGRSLIGAVERVGDFRWRVVLPPQGGEESLDVIELVPNVPVAQG